MSPSESGVTSDVTAAGAGTGDGTGGLGGHHGHVHPAAAAASAAHNAASFTSPSATAAAAALWSKAPPTAAAAAAAAAAPFPVEVTRHIYCEDFPMEARYALTGWLDRYFNEELELGNPEHENHARGLIMKMVQQLEATAASEADFSSKSRLQEVVENIKVGFDLRP